MSETKQKRRHPPLITWLIATPAAVFWCVVSFSMFSSATVEQDREKSTEMYNLGRFEVDFTGQNISGSPPPMVIALGSSLTESAFPFDNFLGIIMRKFYDREIRFVRLSQMGHEISHFYPILDRLIEAKPQAIFIEANMLIYAGGSPSHTLVDYHRGYYRNLLFGEPKGIPVTDAMSEFRRKRERPSFDKNKDINTFEHPMFYSRRPLHKDQSRQDFEKFKRRQKSRFRGCIDEIPEPLTDLFEKASVNGIEVVMLELSGPAKARDVLPKVMQECYRELARKCTKEHGVRYAVFPKKHGLKYYRDFVHLNKKGRHVFMDWFVENFSSTIWQKSK